MAKGKVRSEGDGRPVVRIGLARHAIGRAASKVTSGVAPSGVADDLSRSLHPLEHIPLTWSIARAGEVVGALGRREGVEAAADGALEVVDGARAFAAEQRLQLGEDLLACRARAARGSFGGRIGRLLTADGLRSGL